MLVSVSNTLFQSGCMCFESKVGVKGGCEAVYGHITVSHTTRDPQKLY